MSELNILYFTSFHLKSATGVEPAKNSRVAKFKSVEGFEPSHNKVAICYLKPLGYTLKINDLISLDFVGKPRLRSHFL